METWSQGSSNNVQKNTKDMISGKFGFRSLSFESCAIILSISLIYDNVQLSTKYIDNKKLYGNGQYA